MKQKKRELMMQLYGKYCLDMSKLVFAGIILTTIVNQDYDFSMLLGVGCIFVATFAFIGFKLFDKSRI